MTEYTNGSRLKSLAVQGYKSFASKTDFEFGPAITAVVGPNGSGKSNIADAIRWALGEQSFGLLRGKRTADMIFAGSDSRARAGLASVTIHFDNSDTWLPIDFSEVTISRRASRDGQNDYFLNGQKVRLRDITELLSQSGLSQRTYSVVGQGLVDSVLSLKADERRKLFEEAAGIELHRNRREEALRRLETTQSNLRRLQDILSEVQPRLRNLSRQAERVDAYEQIRRDLNHALRTWYGHHWYTLKDRVRAAREGAQRAAALRDQLLSKQEKIEAELSEAMERLNASRLELSELTIRKSQRQDEKGSHGKQQAVSQARLQWLDEQGARIQAGLESTSLRREQVTARLERTEQELKRLEGELQAKSSDVPEPEQPSQVDESLKSAHSGAIEKASALADALEAERGGWRELEKLRKRETMLLREALASTAKGQLSKGAVAALRADLTALQEQLSSAEAGWEQAVTAVDGALLAHQESLAALGRQIEASQGQLSSTAAVEEHTFKAVELETQRAAQMDLQERLARMEEEIADLEMQAAQVSHERESAREAMTASQQAVDEREATLAEMEQRTQELEGRLRDTERRVVELQSEDRTIRSDLRKADQSHTEAQIARARLEEELTGMKRRIQDDFGLVTYDEVGTGPLQEPLPFEGLVERLKRVKELPLDAESQLQRLRVQLRRLGSVNPDAKKELAEVKRRVKYLTGQIEDLQSAGQQLKELVRELDALMTHEFNKTFAQVGEIFQDMFTRLFGGGEAQILKDEDSEEAESGINIRVKLPGRREQSLAVLSGGERSLTACALIFSLLKVSPPPFAILDEVDAMLDESNVGRFCDILRELSSDTQFLIITHNRQTIQQADVVYGVSLGEDTASRIISLRLDQAEQAMAA